MIAGLRPQLAAMLVLLGRSWTRSSVIAGKAPSVGGLSKVSSGLLRVVFLSAILPAFHGMAGEVARQGASRDSGTRVLLHGALLYAFTTALSNEAPELPGARNILRNALLQSLPLSPIVRVVFALFQLSFIWVMCSAMLIGAAPERAASWVGVAKVLTLSASLYGVGVLLGVAAAALLRVLAPPGVWAKVGWVSSVLSIAGPVVGMNATSIGRLWPAESSFDPMLPAARALAGHGSLVAGLPTLVGLAALAVAICWAVERRGYDRIDAAPHGRPSREKTPIASIEELERLLSSRELGGRTLVTALLLLASGLSAFLAWQLRTADVRMLGIVSTFLAIFLAQIGGSAAIGRAGRSVMRDVRARPLLAPLPLAPGDTLRGKAADIRRLLALLPFAFMPWVVLVPGEVSLDYASRAIALALGLVLLSEAAAAVSFLTNGLGAPGAKGAFASVSFASMLLFLPFVGAVTASSPLASLLSLASLGAVAFEARRAAERCLRWLDDGDEAVERETPVWRALLVFAAFQAVQSMSAQVLGVFAHGLSMPVRVGAAYGLSAVALVLMVVTSRPPGLSLPLLPKRPLWLLAGPALGALSGGLALVYLRVLRSLGETSPALSPSGPAELGALLFAVVVLAPLAEELFFRGWLQPAIAHDLADRRRLAVPLSALAFALVHPSISFVPVLLLGLVCALLYTVTDGLLVAMLAHATHNLIALLFAR